MEKSTLANDKGNANFVNVSEDMSHTLSGNFTLETKSGPTYWWPLIFEVMHMHDFSFSSPDYSKGVSHYYYQRAGNPKDSGIVTGSFKQFWEEIYSGRNEELMAYFWSADADYYNLNISLKPVQKNDQIRLSVLFEGAEVMSHPLQEAGERLFHVLECLETLYQTCKPCTGEVYWSWAGEDFPIWATFGKELAASHAKRLAMKTL